MQRIASLVRWLGCLAVLSTAVPLAAQVWETTANHSGDPQYVALPYEVVFVGVPIVEVPDSDGSGVKGSYQIGTDVLQANEPTAGNHLWVVNRNGAVKKLFPLAVHETMTVTHPDTGQQVPLIDTPLGQLDDASVVEPNVSEDGTLVYFGYFHDTTFNIPSNQGGMSKRGSDLYALDMSPMLADPDVNPQTLPVRRLTFKIYDGSGAQDETDKNKGAMNPGLAASTGLNGWGTVYMHATEMRTKNGLDLVYVSNERRLMNSNDPMGHENHNFNLHIADLKADGSLGAHRQFQYYTTTSALSPTRLRNGIAFSYQATTEDGRNWHIQKSDSEGRWSPLIGYGTNPDLFHLGTFCVDTQGDGQSPPGDYFVATKYYNANNNGFGALWKIRLADAGINTYDDNSSWGVKPKQKGARQISDGVVSADYPSGKDGSGNYIGKITTPACGLPDQLLMAYTPTSANGRLNDDQGNRHIYDSHIAFRSGLDNFHPTDPVDLVLNTGLRTLVDESTNALNLTWPKAVISHGQRTGDAQQQTADRIIDKDSTVTPGNPFAQVGTSSSYNTDRKPIDCWLGAGGGNTPYNPNLLSGNQKEQIWKNFDTLTYVQDPSSFCDDLLPSTVLGIAIHITSNKTNHACCTFGYQTADSSPKEATKLLGVYDVRDQADQSFQALIPSHTPFEFHLIDRQYGLRLVDVRSWHSLYPRETRTNCGGCHQHEEGKAIPFAGKVADSQPPLDMVTATQRVTYDDACQPMLVTSAQPTESAWEWQADIYPGFDQHCGSCHNVNTAPPTEPGLNALAYSNEGDAYNQLRGRYYANSISGALGSPAFWAARGERTDGRDDTLYQPGGGYDGGNWPYHFSTIHATDPNLCGQGDLAKAQWVHRLGQWIDNHMPRDTGASYPYQHDWYHPAVDVAAVDRVCQAKNLRVGYWDDSDFLQTVETYVNDVLIDSVSAVANGSHRILGLTLVNSDRVKVVATDATGNRQIYEKKVKQLKAECDSGGVVVIGIDPVQFP